MTTTCITQIFNNASPLRATGRTHGEYTLHIMRPAFTLCAEAALTPQYPLTHNSLGNIISRLYASIMHKRLQMFAMFDNPTTFAGQFALARCSFFKKFCHTPHQWLHSFLKSPPLQCPITNSLVHLQYLLGQTAKLLAYLAHRTLWQCTKASQAFVWRRLAIVRVSSKSISIKWLAKAARQGLSL